MKSKINMKKISADKLSEIITESIKNVVISESTISRVVNWINNYEIAMITAFRGKKENIQNLDKVKDDNKSIGETYSHKENRERNRELAAVLYRMGYGVTKIKGVYIENFGMPQARLQDEESFLVVNLKDNPNFKKDMFKLSEYYNQDCFCYKAKDNNVAYNIGTNAADYPGYGQESRNGKFVVGVKNEFMSRLGNKGFAFTDNNDMEEFKTSHSERKVERDRKKLRKAIEEEFVTFSNFTIGAKQTIANISESIIKNIQ